MHKYVYCGLDCFNTCVNLQFVIREKRVAFVGISNWALDPAKMNRGVMVTRGKPDEEELVLSARYGITNFITCLLQLTDMYEILILSV